MRAWKHLDTGGKDADRGIVPVLPFTGSAAGAEVKEGLTRWNGHAPSPGPKSFYSGMRRPSAECFFEVAHGERPVWVDRLRALGQSSRPGHREDAGGRTDRRRRALGGESGRR